MRRFRWGRSARVASLMALLTLALAGCSTNEWERDLRFGWPTGVTKQATRMRVLWTWAGVTALALGIVVWGLIFWCCLRYRKKTDELPRQTKYNFAVEMVCFTFPFVILAGLFWRTVVVEDYVNHLDKNPDVKVELVAFKWNWQFNYDSYRKPGSTAQTPLYFPNSGKEGPCQTVAGHQALCTTGNSDLIPVLVIPVNKTVQFDEHSEDVNHSFWVPEFLFKRDVIPHGTTATNQDNKFQITATKVGRYVGRCAELCGTYHSEMNFEVRVVPMATFTRYMAALRSTNIDDPAIQQKSLKAAGMPAYATTTYPFDTEPTYTGPSHRSHQKTGNN